MLYEIYLYDCVFYIFILNQFIEFVQFPAVLRAHCTILGVPSFGTKVGNTNLMENRKVTLDQNRMNACSRKICRILEKISELNAIKANFRELS